MSALYVLKEYSNCTTDILSVPGISAKSVLDNFNKLNDNDSDFIMLKEINFINEFNFITSSLIIEDKSVFEKQIQNDKYLEDIRINSSPISYFENINNTNNNEFIVYNEFLSSINLNFMKVGPSIPSIKCFAQNRFLPVDDINVNDNQTTVRFISILDLKYSDKNPTSNFDINRQEINKLGINSFIFNNKNLKLSSGNSTNDTRKSALRQINNIRILNTIKKEIKLSLFTNNILFNQNSEISLLHTITKSNIDSILEKYKINNIIKNYYTKITDNHNIKSNIRDLENYILRGSIYIELFSNVGNTTDFVNIQLQDILSDLSLNQNSQINNIPIINT